MRVRVYENNVERALKIMKRKIQSEGITKEARRKEFFEKPSEKRRRKSTESEKRYRKELRKRAELENIGLTTRR
ncbi:30S ribosomal protein S21 [Roseibium sp. RKSG952]|nr:30S ribosomal protein S21 [Roseibium sp. RKSG952]